MRMQASLAPDRAGCRSEYAATAAISCCAAAASRSRTAAATDSSTAAEAPAGSACTAGAAALSESVPGVAGSSTPSRRADT